MARNRNQNSQTSRLGLQASLAESFFHLSPGEGREAGRRGTRPSVVCLCSLNYTSALAPSTLGTQREPPKQAQEAMGYTLGLQIEALGLKVLYLGGVSYLTCLTLTPVV